MQGLWLCLVFPCPHIRFSLQESALNRALMYESASLFCKDLQAIVAVRNGGEREHKSAPLVGRLSVGPTHPLPQIQQVVIGRSGLRDLEMALIH